MHVYSLNYLWQQASGKFVPMTAPQYIDTVMSSIQIMLNDELVFPTNTSACPSLYNRTAVFYCVKIRRDAAVSSTHIRMLLTSTHFQTMNSNALSPVSLVTSTVNSSASLPTFTTLISIKFYISAQNPILTPYSPISWRLEGSLICWRSKKF